MEINQITLPSFEDERGGFFKAFSKKEPLLNNFDVHQVNHVVNPQKGILRGLHYQEGEFNEAKLFKVLKGEVQLVAFCFNMNSEDYLQTHSFYLSPHSMSLLVPRGYATGYLVLRDDSEILYMSDNDYYPKSEKGIKWNDSIIEVDWRYTSVIVSEKDQNWSDFEKG